MSKRVTKKKTPKLRQQFICKILNTTKVKELLMNIMKIFCLSLGMMCHAKTFLTVCRFRLNRRLNGFGICLKGLGNPFKKKLSSNNYANLVERNSILDAVREKYSYISHVTLHFICVWLRTCSTISS